MSFLCFSNSHLWERVLSAVNLRSKAENRQRSQQWVNCVVCALFRLCSSNSLEMERNEPTHSEDPNCEASFSSTSPPVGDYEGGTKKTEGNDYEVFLSFRGKDTRNGFTAYLYTSLVDLGIHVFRDDDELHVGEKIGPELIRSITKSKISIPIISEDYASSKWCLRELALMLNCKRNKGQMVLPIFYKVEPWQVEHLTGKFGDAINAHKKNLEEKIVKEWEEALKEVTSLKGLESEKIDNGNEATLVKTVVKRVVRELKRLFLLDLPKHVVGIDDWVRHIMSFIDAKFNDTRIIGIYGMGGIGKTTLAKALYNELSSHYEYRSFVLNIGETSKDKGIAHVQKKLISDIMKKSWDVYDVNEGIHILESRLTSKKVLILLDDVDDNTHLNALIGDKSWFKAGSIVIIMTRNKRILDKASADYMRLLEGLPLDQSLILFSRHAFRKDSPPSNYEKISRALVSTTKGLPLAIEVIASLLSGERMEKWKSTLKELKEVPPKEVQKRLRISYEALDDREKHIFLDIACFFIGESQENPTYMWDACGFLPWSGIEELSHRSLIKIDKDGTFMMHDQLRDLGREIVRLQALTAPQNRSRLWNEEAKCVLDGNIGTSKIEALCLDKIGRSYIAGQFKELNNLRFLSMSGANLIGDFQNLLPQLRWLRWKYCSSDFAAARFHPKRLVVLDLSCSKISEDWGGWDPLKMATELKVLILVDCEALRRTPDLSAFKSLEILDLENCENLEEIHSSIRDINTLISLNVKGCKSLKELPARAGRMEELRELILTSTHAQEIHISKDCLMKLETLYASYCISLPCIPSSIGHLKSLTLLDLTGCYGLTELPDSIGSLLSLQCLKLGASSLRKIPDSIGKLASLTTLTVYFTEVKELPKSIGFLKDLKILDVAYCASLASIPSSVGRLTSLSYLDLSECRKLVQLPDSIGSLVSLRYLLLHGCCLLREIPASIGKLTSLTSLDLNSTAIVELPESIGQMQNLKMLDIGGTPVIKLLGDSGIMAELQELRVAGWKSLEGLSCNTSKQVLLNKLDLDQKLSELHSRLLALVHLKRPRTPPANNSARVHQTVDSEHLLKRTRPFGISDEPPAIAAFGSGNATIGESLGDRGAPEAAMFVMNSESMANVKPGIADKSGDKLQLWKLIEINEPSQCRSIRLPDNLAAMRVSRLIYKNGGHVILALTSNAVHKRWKWQKSDRNLTGRATTGVVPQLWYPPNGISMTNDISDTNPEEAVPCFALSKNDGYLIAASGGKITLFDRRFERMRTFMPPLSEPTSLLENKDIITIEMDDSSIQIHSGQVNETMTTFMPPPPAATFLAFHPQDNNIVAIGMEDSSILMYELRVGEVQKKLKGHQKRITGLAFSNVLNVLVSSGADFQLCVWSIDEWEKQASRFLQMPTRLGAAPLADTRVQFNVDKIHLLVVHDTQIATYEATKLECLQQWVTREASGPITDATYSCNGQSIYVSFEDGSIGVFTASALGFRCRINPAAYILPNSSLRVHPLVIAAHPFDPNQFALGLTDGSVYVLEPLECEGEWGASPPVEDRVGPSATSSTTNSDQPPLAMADEAGLAQIWATRLRPRRVRPPPCDLGMAIVKRKKKC